MNESSVDAPAIDTEVIGGCMRRSVETPSRSTKTPHPHDQSVTPLSQLRPDCRQWRDASILHSVTRAPRLTASARANDNVEKSERARAST